MEGVAVYVSAGWSCVGVSRLGIGYFIRDQAAGARWEEGSWSKIQRGNGGRESYCAPPTREGGSLVASNAFIRILIQEFIPLARLFGDPPLPVICNHPRNLFVPSCSTSHGGAKK